MEIPDKIYCGNNGHGNRSFSTEKVYDTMEEYIRKDAILEFFFGCIGRFNHYAYFTDELWRKVEGFKRKDEAEVKCAFLSIWTKYQLDITTYPVGSSWCCSSGNESIFNDYVKEWKPLFDDFDKWCESQR